MDSLAPSLKLTSAEIAQHLVSQYTGLRRQGVQALVVRMATLHIRFMLHRPYASGEVVDWPSPPQDEASMAGSKAKGKQTKFEAYLEALKEKEYRRAIRHHADEHATSLAKAIEAAQELIELAAVTVPNVRRTCT